MRWIVKSVLGALLLCAASLWAADQPRVYVSDSRSWEVGGGTVGVDGALGGSGGGGARPQTAEIIKTFNERCRNVIINDKRDRADYRVLLDHEGGKSPINKDNKIAIFNRDGDMIFSRSTRSLGNAVQDGCSAIIRDWTHRPKANAEVEVSPAEKLAAGESAVANVMVTSNPVGADIEVDGAFVGSTPSTINLQPGDHDVSVKKAGFQMWNRKIHVTGGNVNLSAELEKPR